MPLLTQSMQDACRLPENLTALMLTWPVIVLLTVSVAVKLSLRALGRITALVK
jgi:hypothetical protein